MQRRKSAQLFNRL